ncbi:MAG: elongation factor EF-2 [Candidatus Micrarchaeia archaeon]|jgi:elongation factor 2
MVRKEYVAEEVVKIMQDITRVRNVAIIAHVHHGKTTLTDALLAKAGIISKTVAGEILYTNYDEIEKERRLTIKSANISLAFDYGGKDYIINLIDTPGHVDFSGHVTRSMRAVDGVILVIDPVEGIMPQTETVLRQAFKEKAKPVLFVNKVDRLLTELKLTPEQTYERFLSLINDVNKLMVRYGGEELAEKWKINVASGNVAFGSAYERWAISSRIMEKYKVTFKDIFKLTAEGNMEKLREIAPIDEAILNMVVEHLPNPREAQSYRLPNIWHGDLNSEEGQAMLNADPTKSLNIAVFSITYDQHAGEVAIGRVFSGTARKGVEVYVSGLSGKQKIQQVALYMGPDRVPVEAIPAGNIVAIIGLKDVSVGDTLSETGITPFEEIRHYSPPVVAKAIEAKETKDTVRLIEALRELSKEDPTFKAEINQETGEHIIRGLGELHLEIIETKLRDEYKIPIITSDPIVVYRETIEGKVENIEGKAPNRHSKFYINVEPLEKSVVEAIEQGVINEGRPKGKDAVEKLVNAGLPREQAKNCVDIKNSSILVDATHGVQYMNEVMELLIDGFEEAMDDGPLAREKCTGIKVLITDATIHEDPVHRGPAQIIPAIRRPINAGMLLAHDILLEPKQIFTISIPSEYLNDVINMLQGRRGHIESIDQEGEEVTIKAKMPVAEVIKGFSNELRSITSGRAIWYMEYAGYEKLPAELQDKVVREIRKRKGIPEEPPKPEDFLD